jgi:hypothetical protein
MELLDRGVELSKDVLEDYLKHYQTMVAARHGDLDVLRDIYRDQKDLILSIDGIQPEKGHETLYVVRELRLKRILFAEPLLSSAESEIDKLFERAREVAEQIGKTVRCWVSDKQQAFVNGVKRVFPGVPHRYCTNHFLRDLAKPILEEDSHAKVQMRKKVRGLRDIERQMLKQKTEASLKEQSPVDAKEQSPVDAKEQSPVDAKEQSPVDAKEQSPVDAKEQSPVDAKEQSPVDAKEQREVVLDYCAAVRGILNNDQGTPLEPPGLRMAEGLKEVAGSIRKVVSAKKGAQRMVR